MKRASRPYHSKSTGEPDQHSAPRKRLYRQVEPEQESHSLERIDYYSTLAVNRALLRIPGLDLILIARLQWNMLNELAEHHGLRWSKADSPGRFALWLKGYNLFSLGGSLLGSALKWIPYVGAPAGQASVSAAAAASTRQMGLAFLEYIATRETEDELTIEELSRIFRPATGSEGP